MMGRQNHITFESAENEDLRQMVRHYKAETEKLRLELGRVRLELIREIDDRPVSRERKNDE